MTDTFYKLARPLMRGVKTQIRNGEANESIKNNMVRDLLRGMPQFDGEIVIGKPEDTECHEMTELFLESEVFHPFIFWVYDMKTTDNYGLRERLQIAEPMVVGACGPYIQFVDHVLVQNKQELDAYAEKVIKQGFPGIVLREPFGTFGTYDEEVSTESLGSKLQ